jgi:hypothetical protein
MSVMNENTAEKENPEEAWLQSLIVDTKEEALPSTPASFLSDAIRQNFNDKLVESFLFYLKGVAGILGGIFLCNPVYFIKTVFNLLRTILGLTLGIGFGAGLANHVFHQLQKWQSEYDRKQQQELKVEAQSRQRKSLEQSAAGRLSRQKVSLSTRGGIDGVSSMPSIGDAVSAEDGDTYVSLMAQAGYPIHDRILRGQVLGKDHKFWNVLYRFTDTRIPIQQGVRMVGAEWPALPKAVTRELGRFIEHVMRDYVSGWYSLFDSGILHRPEQEKRDDGIPRDGGDNDEQNNDSGTSRNSKSSISVTTTEREQNQQRQNSNGNIISPKNVHPTRTSITTGSSSNLLLKDPTEGSVKNSDGEEQHREPRKMVFSTLTHRRAPMIDCCYRMMSSAFGNLATRAEHVNLLELVMIKWTQVLGQTLKEYRTLWKAAQDKKIQQSHMSNSSTRSSDESSSIPLPVPSEVEVTREFLLTGKLHRAVVFGLDIPSLLFADASGEECGLGGANDGKGGDVRDPIHVLESRLYHSNILKECELDYNRVLANRLIRTLMPKSETNSQCVVALVTEIIAGTVLTPLMNLWIPSFLNGIIVKIMSTPSAEESDGATTTTTSSSSSETSNTEKNHSSTAATNNVDDISQDPIESFTNDTYSFKELVDKNRSDFIARANIGIVVVDNRAEQMNASTQEMALPVGLNEPSTRSDSFATHGGVISTSFRGNDNDKKEDEGNTIRTEYMIMTLSSLALTDLAMFVDFEKCRIARQNHEEIEVDWDNAEYQHSILKLVMVIETALLDGRCAYADTNLFPDLLPVLNDDDDEHNDDDDDDDDDDNNISAVIQKKASITELLFDMTSNMDTFEERIAEFLTQNPAVPRHDRTSNNFEPDANEISAIRTLISTWLHTGQLFRAIKLICKAADNILAAYYANGAFLSIKDDRERFARQMKVLDGVDIMFDTMSVLASQRLVLSEAFDLLPSTAANMSSNDINTPKNKPVVSDIYQYYGRQSTPRYLDFQRNEAFAASLRAERGRRWRSWQTRKMDKDIQSVIRKTASPRENELHSEMHNLARLFHNGTSIMTIRDAARKRGNMEESSKSALDEKISVSLLTVEIISSRRRIEVPDDDSSFLLRAQSRPLNPLSIHLDDRNHDMSYKCFLGTYEEPATPQGSSRYSGGRYLRQCFLQYYPSDRTALIVLQKDARKLDKRKGNGLANGSGQDKGNDEQTISSYFSHTFLRQRYLCQKVTATQSFLSSSLMESTDFNAFPRTGKALDFVYRMSLFDRPVVDLAGKLFKIEDSASRGVHRADASSFEVSDASLTYVLLKIGKDYGSKSSKDLGVGNVETGPDGYPVLFLRFTKSGDQTGTELKPYRLSFVRAALMVTSARQEAQLQSLIKCVKAGSAKSATKARTEERLRPVKKILYFANDRADHHCLNQDLKIGHFLDRGQLQRNGLLNLRHPTSILQLDAKVEGSALAKEVPIASLSSNSHTQDTVLYKIRCTVFVELVDVDPNGVANELEPYALDDGSYATVYREEFVVYRSMKEFQILHKQLKSQVALTESTMSTGNRIVGAATAALSTSSRSLYRRRKQILIPSLAQAGKIGSMGITQRSITKRVELLDEYIGYLLSSNSLLKRCSELLVFLGASYPFPPEVTVTKAKSNVIDLLGRTDFIRSVALKDGTEGTKLKVKNSPKKNPPKKRTSSTRRRSSVETINENSGGESIESISMDPAILNKVDQVPLAEVRNRIVELTRLSFSFENASFVRSQMLSALETASFVAVAKQSDFRRVLHDLHARHLSGDAIGGWIRTLLDILWPDGVWGKAKPLLTKEEEDMLRDEAKIKLQEGFPDQFRKILGKELTVDGLE